jgi:hypothetical protein
MFSQKDTWRNGSEDHKESHLEYELDRGIPNSLEEAF